MVEGKSNKEIARDLGISSRTVEDHRCDIYRRMGVTNAVALVRKIFGARIAELQGELGMSGSHG
jgi:DNA-binding NarL/FixJ family response regulator